MKAIGYGKVPKEKLIRTDPGTIIWSDEFETITNLYAVREDSVGEYLYLIENASDLEYAKKLYTIWYKEYKCNNPRTSGGGC